MVLVYHIKDDLNVLPVSKQSFSQIGGDLKGNKKLLLSGNPPIRTLRTETASSTLSIRRENHPFNHKIQQWRQFRPQSHTEGHLPRKLQGTKIKTISAILKRSLSEFLYN